MPMSSNPLEPTAIFIVYMEEENKFMSFIESVQIYLKFSNMGIV